MDLFELRKRYDNLTIRNESTASLQVVIPFLKMLNYKEEWIATEVPVLSRRNRADIVVFIERKQDRILFVEVKKPDKEVEKADIEQLLNYLNTINVEYGIITNGKVSILLNNKIDGNALQKEIFRFNLKDATTEHILKYFSYRYLFENDVTRYFKDLAQFKIYKFEKHGRINDKSWSRYENTLKNFFSYMCEIGDYEPLNTIRPKVFKDFLLSSISDKKNTNSRYAKSRATVINQYRHIIGFYDTLRSKRYVNSNPFELITKEDMLNDLSFDKDEKDFEPLSHEEAASILKAFELDRSDIRNRLIFLLILYSGLDRGEIKDVKISDLTDSGNIIVGNRVIPLPKPLLNLIYLYMQERKEKGIDCEYLFCGKYGGIFGVMSDNSFNVLINKALINANLPKKRQNEITPYFIKESLVKRLFEIGYHIEEIVYLTGLSLGTISKYISTEDIENKVSLNKLVKKHPYIDFFS